VSLEWPALRPLLPVALNGDRTRQTILAAHTVLSPLAVLLTPRRCGVAPRHPPAVTAPPVATGTELLTADQQQFCTNIAARTWASSPGRTSIRDPSSSQQRAA